MTLQQLVPRSKVLAPLATQPVEPWKGRPIQILRVPSRVSDFQQGTQNIFSYLVATLRRSW
jgi:hypothetical protein